MDDTPPRKAAPYNPSRGAYINPPKADPAATTPAKPAQPYSGRMPPMAPQKKAVSDPAPAGPQAGSQARPQASPEVRGDPTGLNADLGDDGMDQTDKLAE